MSVTFIGLASVERAIVVTIGTLKPTLRVKGTWAIRCRGGRRNAIATARPAVAKVRGALIARVRACLLYTSPSPRD
eukprot:9370002-Alexandrium_andersonii.AAC.1